MKAIAVVPGTTTVRLGDRPEPRVVAADDVKVQVLRVGICGTDREEAGGGRALRPDGQQDLVIGHEMFGRVVAVGPAVTRVRPGDYAVFTVRRGCGRCRPCLMSRPDMCTTGDYRERGIWGLDGYQTEFVVDKECFIVRVPPDLEPVGVLTEPLSVAEKAIDEAVRVQAARLPEFGAAPDWLEGRRCLIAGLGPVGLLAAMALRRRGADVCGLDVVDADSARPRWIAAIGGRYIDGRRVTADKLEAAIGPVEVIVEATGVASLEFDLIDALGRNGVYVLTGIPGGNRPIDIPGADLIRRLVLGNLAMVGSVNASRDHFEAAVDDLGYAMLHWRDQVTALITHRHACADFAAALATHPADEIKSVVEWGEAAGGTR